MTGKDAAHERVDANHPGSAAGGRRRGAGRRGLPVAGEHQEAELTVQNIHDQLDALDPATRAAVVARLTSDEVTKVHERHQ